MVRKPERYFQTTLTAVSILVLAIWNERVHGGLGTNDLLKPLPNNLQEIILTTVDGVKIVGNYFIRRHQSLIILLDGLYSMKDDNFKRALPDKLGHRYDTLNIDFRGQGRSGGEFTGGIKEAFDIQEAVYFVR